MFITYYERRKKKEEEAKKRFGYVSREPTVVVLGGGEKAKQYNAGGKDIGRKIVNGVKNAFIQSAQLEANNQEVFSNTVGDYAKNTGNAMWNGAGNLGSAQAQMQKTAVDTGIYGAKAAGTAMWNGAGNLGNAQVQMQKTTLDTVNRTAKDAAGKYGEIWGVTTGITGSDQTGASIWGYQQGRNHVGRRGAENAEQERRIRASIADGGADVLLHALGARATSGFGTLDRYNKYLEYAATGKITDDNTVTPGRYSEIVDEAIAEYLSKKKGTKAGELYSSATEITDEVVSALTLGPILSGFKSSIDASGDSLEKARGMGVDDKTAVEYGVMSGISNALSDVIANQKIQPYVERMGEAAFTAIERGMNFNPQVKKAADTIAEQIKGAFVDGSAEGIYSISDSVLEAIRLEEKSQFANIVQQQERLGFSEQAAKKVAIAEMLKKGSDAFLDEFLTSPIERSFYETLKKKLP